MNTPLLPGISRVAGPLSFTVLLAATLAGCGWRRADWPTLAPRPGEVLTMVPRNMPGFTADSAPCPGKADCGPPAATAGAAVVGAVVGPDADLQPAAALPTRAEVDVQLTAIAAALDAITAAAGPARTARDRAAAAAGGVPGSAAASRAQAADAVLAAALAPLASIGFRLQALDMATRLAPDRAAYADALAAAAARIAALEAQ